MDESNGYEGIADICIKGRGRAIHGIGAGAGQYRALMLASGLTIGEEFIDEGGNHYFSGGRPAN